MGYHALSWRAFVIAVLLLGMSPSAFAGKPTAEEQQRSLQSIQKMVASRHYLLSTSQATGMTGASISVQGTMKITDEIIRSTLPYWGNGYNTFGGDSFLSFKGTISDYRTELGKKNKLYLYITATETGGRTYSVKVEIFHNGVIFMSINGSNLQPMRYSGVIGPIDTEEKDFTTSQQSSKMTPFWR